MSVRSNTPAGCRELRAPGRVQVYVVSCLWFFAQAGGRECWPGGSGMTLWFSARVSGCAARNPGSIQGRVPRSILEPDVPRATHDRCSAVTYCAPDASQEL